MAFARVRKGALSWTRGQPASFRSSSLVERQFCAACGTPLTDNLIALGICFALMAVLWLVYRKFFADIVDPIVKDCVGSIQKHLGIRKSG